MGRSLSQKELQLVSGGTEDEIVVTGTRIPPVDDSLDGYLFGGGFDWGYLDDDWSDEDEANWDDGNDYTEEIVSTAETLSLAAMEDALKNAEKDGLEYIKFGDKIFKVADLLKALPAIGHALDGVDLLNAAQSGDGTEFLNVLGDVAIGVGIGLIASSIGAPVLAGAAVAIVVTHFVDVGDIAEWALNLDYGVEMGTFDLDLDLEPVLDPRTYFPGIPNIDFDDEDEGWRSIFNREDRR